MSTTPRTLIIGLDGATFDLLGPMIQAGDLPTLSGLMSRGAHGRLHTRFNSNSAAAWSSMVTGYNPGRHGIYHFSRALQHSDAGTGWSPVTARDRQEAPFWRLLSAAGQRVSVINVPITYPADPINGVMLAGMDTPSLNSPGFSHPAGLLEELRAHGIAYTIDVPNLGPASRRNPTELPESVARMIDARGRTMIHFMRSRPWDAFMAVFVATDRVQHYYWPRELSNAGGADWAPIRNVYRQIDQYIAQALALVDEDTTVIVVSDHGFGRSLPAKRGLNLLFGELGLLRFRQRPVSVRGRMLKKLLQSGRQLLPFSVQDRLARRMPGLHLRAVNELSHSLIDWTGTKVYASPQGGRVWLNVEGRRPDGVVPLSDYESLRERVLEIVGALTDPATGRRVVREVHRREDVFHGPHVDQAPDLVVEWEFDALDDALAYSDNGRPIVVRPEKANRRGNRWRGSHRPQGIFIACGGPVRSGALLDDATIYDIVPTVLYLQGQAIPDDMDGKVLAAMFTEQHLRSHPVVGCGPASPAVEPRAEGLDENEERAIEARLRDLGYLE
jgi:predicted AlkP superfamily phosphohydrolase/phosphomutase